ncbi:MAG: HAD family hydrolase [Candidatus Limnocylindrales bacterium]
MTAVLPQPELIFFDVGDTLIRPDPSWVDVYLGACHEFGLELTREILAEGFRAALASGALDEMGPFEASPEASFARIRGFDEAVMAATGHAGLPDAFFRTIGRRFQERASWHVFPEVPGTLEALAAAGIRRAVISNWIWEAPELLHELELAPWFETLVISDHVGYNKPHPGIFREALSRTGVEPARALHVGDSYRNDVLGARALGIAPVLVARGLAPGTRPSEVPVDDPVPVVTNLVDLLALVGLGA